MELVYTESILQNLSYDETNKFVHDNVSDYKKIEMLFENDNLVDVISELNDDEKLLLYKRFIEEKKIQKLHERWR